jgi:Fic family protein
MSLYWPAFEFYYGLDVSRLIPHLAAIEAYREAASTRVLPPPWREQPVPDQSDVAGPGSPVAQQTEQSQIIVLKQELQNRNASRTRAWVKQRFVPGSAPMSLPDILTMHRMVAEESGVRYENPGVLRHSGLAVVVGRKEVGGFHTGAPEGQLPRLMEQYIQFIKSEDLRRFDPSIHALVAHFFFTTIHPFDDGNGRVSRLVSAGILFQRGYNGHGFYALSNYFYQNDLKYHTLLHHCWQQPPPFDLTPFIAFGMEGLAMELQGINSFVKMKLHRTAERANRVQALNHFCR